jgi:hypothetical protein
VGSLLVVDLMFLEEKCSRTDVANICNAFKGVD